MPTPYGMWDLSSCPGIEPTPPAVEVWSQPLDHQGSPCLCINYHFFPLLKTLRREGTHTQIQRKLSNSTKRVIFFVQSMPQVIFNVL